MFTLSNIKITKSKIDETSINSNGFWFTPMNGEFNVDGVVGFITNELPSPMWLDGKTFSSLNHLFVTESQTNLFMALCPFVEVDGHSFELKYSRFIGGHQLHVTKSETEETEEETETAEEPKEESEEKTESEEKAESEEKEEESEEAEEKEEAEPKEEKVEKKTTARRSSKK